MTQGWTIVDSASGDVLAPWFETPSFGSHPKDNGWAWDAETQAAHRVDAPPQPGETFDGTAWALPLSVCQDRRWAQARALRDACSDGGCDTPLGRVDTDSESRLKISGAVQMAMIAQMSGVAFDPIDWTMSDNSVVTHDSAALITMGVAVGEHVAACHGHGQTLREAIYAAEDLAAVAAVDIDTGWPA